MNVRIARLEHIIEMALPQYCSQGNATPLSDTGGFHDNHRHASPIDDGNRSQPEDEDTSGGIFESGKWYGNSAAGLVAAPAVLEQVRIMFFSHTVTHPIVVVSIQLQSMVPSPPAENSSGNTPLSGQFQRDVFNADQKPTITPMDMPATERLQRLMRDCGFGTDRLQSMYDDLPSRKMRDDLVNHYFSTMYVWTFGLSCVIR